MISIYPNPSQGGAAVRMALKGGLGEKAQWIVSDIRGRRLAWFSGSGPFAWAPKGMAAGVYIVEVRAGKVRLSRKILLTP